MDQIQKLQLQWMATRYAIDQIDIAWSYNPEEFEGELYEQERIKMKSHRDVLCQMQEDILTEKYKLEMKV